MRHFLHIIFAAAVLAIATPVSAKASVSVEESGAMREFVFGEESGTADASATKSAEGQGRDKHSESLVHIGGENYWVHSVVEGETLRSLAVLYGVGEKEIASANPLARHGIKQGQVLKIPASERLSADTEPDTGTNTQSDTGANLGANTQSETRTQSRNITRREASKLFDEHVVRAGETAYSIARSYGISLTTLMEDNPEVDPTVLSIGLVLQIRKKEQGETEPWQVTEQWEGYRDAANRVSDDYIYHIVAPGETLYGLSHSFGVTQDTIVVVNMLRDGLKAGSMIRIPVAPTAQTQTEYPSTELAEIPEQPTAPDSTRGREFRQTWEFIPEIALMLPLANADTASSTGGSAGSVGSNTTSGTASSTTTTGTATKPLPVGTEFADFYRGALLALDHLKSLGRSLNVTLYNTARSADRVFDIVASPEFSDTNLIIGPVYEAEMTPALQFAEVYGVPMVSPLATVRELDGDMLYQMAPDPATKYDKVEALFAEDINIILVSSAAGNDREFEREITVKLGKLPEANHKRFTIGISGNGGRVGASSGSLGSLIDWNRKNVFVVLAASELEVNSALATISTAYNNLSSRTGRKTDITVLGGSRWAMFGDTVVDKNLFFKLGVCFVTSYYVDRSNRSSANFEGKYLGSYGNFPSRAAYRGYDAVALFGEALFAPGYSFDDRLTAAGTTPLETPYKFVRMDDHKRRVNIEWTLVRFTGDYNVVIE